MILRLKSLNQSCHFWGLNWKTRTTSFDVKSEETITIGFEAKPEKTVPVVLRPNHWQTVHLSFEPQPRNPLSTPPCARYKPHMMLPDLPIIWPPSIRLVRPSPVICTRSATPATILVTVRHAAPITCTPRDKQTWFSTRTKIKVKQTEMSRIQI
jgi:hypothetical protein